MFLFLNVFEILAYWYQLECKRAMSSSSVLLSKKRRQITTATTTKATIKHIATIADVGRPSVDER